ncbi:hypothetical protein KFK09_028427 [Dendrobium nobile]|uniref:Uncharacterized protein n=1 Tax=Dendrobium nobile TaxID=94219 RepID=A0A8T3A3B4_DENNO|nr:hypothetical protein KFK09_028427 [Dendrobium nobile]
MGNTSCAPCPVYGAGSNPVKAIDSNGRVHVFLYSVKAEELMLENPGQFVCDSTYLQVGCRIRGLNVDEDLMRRRLYFLLPNDLLFSVLTEEEMKCLLGRATGAMKVKRRRRSKRKILRTDDECLREFLPERKQSCDQKLGVGRMQRLRSWEPALDTIYEEWIKI